MPFWAIVLAFAAIPAVFFFLFRLRYRFDWAGGKTWSAALEYGLPGFMRTRRFSSAPAPGQAGFIDLPSFFRLDPKRLRRALFRMAMDVSLLRALARFAVRGSGATFRLLDFRMRCAVSHPDPALLGRFVGYYHAALVLPGARRIDLRFRFQDRHVAAAVSAWGGFSAARFLIFLLGAMAAFPWRPLLRSVWRGWPRDS